MEAMVFVRPDSVLMIDFDDWSNWEFGTSLGRVDGIGLEWKLRRIALGDENGLHVFDMDTGELQTSIPVPNVADIHWLSDTKVLVGTSAGGWATVSLRAEDLIASARTGLTRSFTPEECETYRVDPCPALEEIRSS